MTQPFWASVSTSAERRITRPNSYHCYKVTDNRDLPVFSMPTTFPSNPPSSLCGWCFMNTVSSVHVLFVFGSPVHVLVIGNLARRLSCPRFSLSRWIHFLVETAWSSIVLVTNCRPTRLCGWQHICQTNVDSTFMQRSTLLVLWASKGPFKLGKKGNETLYNTQPITQGKPNKFIWQKGMGVLSIKEAQATGSLYRDKMRGSFVFCLFLFS